MATPEGAKTYQYDAGNKNTNNRYDKNGNRIEDARHRYTWDAENRLIKIGYKNNPKKSTEFKYDGQSRRVAIIETDTTGKTETRYTWCGDVICQARDAKGKPVAYYFKEGVYRPQAKSNKKEYYARDHLGSIRDVLDETGNPIARYDYDPYGNLINKPEKQPELGYAGMQYHAPSRLYLTKYRAYDPKDGRWLSRDPIEETGGINLYAYVNGNPISYIDPLGLDIWIEGPSGLEPSYHQSINVGNPNGAYSSYSFGMNGNGLQGEVYRDIELGGPIEVYKKTTPEQDASFKAQLESMVGNKGIYGYNDICRSWSQRQFKTAPGISSKPPIRMLKPHTNVSPLSSRSTTGTSSTTGTGTSK